ncbi:Os04g0218201 [Oryza sativa Japonica Group]|uniref:OSJNBa0060B20.10 protein n=2 Tax=Oryza sativa subsp. japonica TaxID=39947 RepID=B9FDU0_ORYSJ|nr:hypothetical protein OsJ_13859 [Oryza sativa Japonica Group]BAS88151.1 Os04g0218201 [Oryza sativa Japonica Group]CAD39780.1 OSJNBa0060B20.10 [Oryza sativa Japonica Group]
MEHMWESHRHSTSTSTTGVGEELGEGRALLLPALQASARKKKALEPQARRWRTAEGADEPQQAKARGSGRKAMASSKRGKGQRSVGADAQRPGERSCRAAAAAAAAAA